MKKYFYAAAFALLPTLAFAQQLSNIDSLIVRVRSIINEIIPVIIGLAILFFIYALLKYVTAGGDEAARKEAIGLIITGVIVIFVMTAVWGLVGFVAQSIDLPSSQETYPQV